MTPIRDKESRQIAKRTQELVFAGDKVRLAGQVDYPQRIPPPGGYPLLFILHHAGGHTRDAYQHFTEVGLAAGYAVFRWDKRGTGRSGGGGRGSTTQDAVNAYEIALEQASINNDYAVILAPCSATVLLGSSFGLFARVQHPHGALLTGNMLDEKAILAIDTRVKIVMGGADWRPVELFGEASCAAHNKAYTHGASLFVAPHADRLLMDTRTTPPVFHEEARAVIHDWLESLCPVSTSI